MCNTVPSLLQKIYYVYHYTVLLHPIQCAYHCVTLLNLIQRVYHCAVSITEDKT